MTKTKLTILILALVCVLTALLCIPIMAAEEESVSGGLTLRGAVESSTSQVYSIDTYEMANDLDIMPTTLEAWVYVPSLAASSHLGTLYGNFYIDSKYGTSFLNFEVATGGIPRVHWADSICGDYDILFENSALDQDAWTHLSIVYDGNSGIVSCYLNGELSEEKYYFPTIDPDVLEVPMYLGGDKNHMNPNYFKGSIGDLTVYSDVRTSSEISADYGKGMEMTANNADLSDAICYYDIDSKDLGKNIADESGNGRDMIYSKRWLTEDEMANIRKSYGFEPAYSFAVIGDIQAMTDYHPDQLPGLYKWIIDNKDSKNIVFSITLGDITNDNGRDDKYSKDANGIYYIDKNGQYIEWDVAYDAITQLDGNIPYALVRGNHDVYPDYNGIRLEGFNTYFENSDFFTAQYTAENGGGRYGDGQYDTRNDVSDIVTGYANSYANCYQTLTVGETKYLIICLDWILKEEIVTWAGNVIAGHPEHKVIISTHAYLNGDGTTLDIGDPTPRSNYNGDVLWNELVSKYPNVEFVLSGHIGSDNIEVSQVKAPLGNTVTEMLINQQSYDSLLGGCGTIAMFYFDETGEKLAVEWYSASKNLYYKNINQFTLDLNADVDVRTNPVWDGVTTEEPAGNGSEESPYLIENAANLYWISRNINSGNVSFAGKYFKQTSDIDLGGKAMPSIGSYYANSRDMAAFGGIYDGQGFSVMNGTVTAADDTVSFSIDRGYGLFGVIYGATLKNIVIDNIQIIGRGVTGTIVGRAAAPTLTDKDFAAFNSIVGCEISDSVRIVTVMTNGTFISPKYCDDDYRAGRVGSVCGMAYSTSIQGCSSYADINLSSDFTLAGGIVGTVGLNSSVEYCIFGGTISIKNNNTGKNAYIGGLIGAVSPTLGTYDSFGKQLGFYGSVSVKNSYSDCALDCGITEGADNVYYGGLVGFFGDLADVDDDSVTYPYIIENCYNLSVCSSAINASGLVGYATAGEKTLYIRNCLTVSVKSGASEYTATDGNTVSDNLPAIVAEGCSTLAPEEIAPYVSSISAHIAEIKNSTYTPIWIIGNGTPSFSGFEGLKYLNVVGNSCYNYQNGAWVAVKNINITENSLETKYGTIDSKYKLNSMVVFLYNSDGTYSCIGGSDSITDIWDLARTNTQGSTVGKKVVIYFRGNVDYDYNYTNISYSTGTVVFDLNGNTLYQANQNVGLFSGHAKAPGYCHPNTVIVENGNIVLKTAGLFHQICAGGGEPGKQYEVNTTDTNYKVSDFIFNGVNISLAENATLTSLIGSYRDTNLIINRNAKMGLNVFFDDDCVIDITNAPSNFVLFDACDPVTSGDIGDYKATNSIVHITVGACDIKASNSFVWHKINSDNGSSVTYTKNNSGNFVTLTVPSDITPDTTSTFSGEYGYVYGLNKSSETDGFATYTLGTLDTPYGNIPDGQDYVFVIFRGNSDGTYTYVKGYDTFAEALAYAGNNVAKEVAKNKCVVYMTRSAGSGTSNGSGNSGFNIGTMVIDLGGHTLTQENSEPLIRVHPKYDNGIATSKPNEFYLNGYYQFINGNIVLKNGLFYVGTEGSGYANHDGPYDKTVYWTLDGINISLAPDANITNVITSFRTCTTLSSEKDITFDLTINDNCTLDISGVKDGNKVMLFNANDANGLSDNLNAIVKINIEGLSITAKDYNFDWHTVADNGSSVIYTNENAVTVNVGGKTNFREEIYTPYGNVSAEYIGMNFAVFKYADGEYTCVYGNDSFASALAADKVGARIYCASEGTTAVVYMLKDYASDAGISGNLCYINGTMIIDLGGHTLSQAASEPIFRAYAKCTHSASNLGSGVEHTATFKLINGDIILNNHGLFNVGMEGGSAYAVSQCHKTLNWTLDGINISLKSGATLTSIFTAFKENSGYAPSGYDSSTPGRAMRFNLTVNENCTVDISNATKSVNLFNANDSSYKGIVSGKSYCVTDSEVDITILGCEIITGNAAFTFSSVNKNNGSSVVFGKPDNGNYISVTLSKDAAENINPSAKYTAPDGTELVFIKIDENTDTVTYRMRPYEVASIDFVPKMSLTLDRDLVLNIYVPAKDFLTGFTLDGKSDTEYTSTPVTLDGNDYYLIKIALSAKEAAKEIVLKATVAIEGKTATGTFTFGIVKYAEKVLEDGTEFEKSLVLNVLSYVRAAYTYFGTNDSYSISKIDALLGENYDENNVPELEGSAVAPSAGLSSISFLLNATPTIRFYIPDGADAASYRFFVNGNKIETEVGSNANGTYIDLDTYAYVIAQTVTYTVNGTEYGSFHINAYLEWTKTQSDGQLLNLVMRFAAYCESAKAYYDEFNA